MPGGQKKWPQGGVPLFVLNLILHVTLSDTKCDDLLILCSYPLLLFHISHKENCCATLSSGRFSQALKAGKSALGTRLTAAEATGGTRSQRVAKGYSVTSNGSQIISVMRDLLFSQRFRLFCSYLYFAFYPTWLPRDSKFAANKTALFFGTSPEPWAKGTGYAKVKKLRK